MPWRKSLYVVLVCTGYCSIFSFQRATAQRGEESAKTFWAPSPPPSCFYKIHSRIDTVRKLLTASEVVRLTNPTHRPIYRLAFDWSVNESKTLSITVQGRPVTVFGDSGQRTLTAPIIVDLPAPLAGGASIDIEAVFSLSVPQLGEQGNIRLTEWFPRLWWGVETQDNFDVRLDLPGFYTLATSGRYDAATRSYRAEHIRTFGLFFGEGLRVAEAMSGDVLVRCLYTAKADTCAHLILSTAVDAIDYYRRFLGFFPYKSLSIIPGFDYPAGGFNVATSMSVIHGEERMALKPEIHWRWITAHEIGHMYWGEYVMDKDLTSWLWIGLGIYGDREYIRARGWSLQMHRNLMNRYIHGVRKHLNTTVAITPEQEDDIDFDFNNVVTHGKGFSIISALANYLGKETFKRIYLRCLREFGGKRLGTPEFESICEAESGENLEWFFDAWLRSNQYPSYQITAQQCEERNGAFLSTISVERLGTMKMPVPVVCYFADGTSQQTKTDRLLDINTLRFESKAQLVRVQIDPDSEIAMIVPPPEPTKEELTKRINRLPWSGAGKEALTLYTQAAQLQPTGEDTWFRLSLTLYDGEYYQQALDAFGRATAVSRDSSDIHFASLVWQGHILDLLGQRDGAIQQYKSALRIESGQEMRHSQYGMIVNRAWVEARLKIPFQRR